MFQWNVLGCKLTVVFMAKGEGTIDFDWPEHHGYANYV